MYKYAIFITIAFWGFNSCSLFIDTCYQEYEFTFPCSLSPKKDTFSIGDTIWMSFFIPTNVYDNISQQEYSFGDFEHKINFSIDSAGSVGTYFDEQYFDIVNIKGRLILGSLGIDRVFRLDFDSSTSGDSVEFAIIPKNIGTYVMNFGYATTDYYSEKNSIIKENCTEYIQVYLGMNNRDSDNNYEMIPDYFEQTNASKEETLDAGVYIFRVIQ
jgi:hypothetical protein